MALQGLILHCGANRATLDEVKAVETPKPSFRGDLQRKMFYPISHASLLENTLKELRAGGYNVTEEAHALTKEGMRYFGLLQLRHRNDELNRPDYGLVVGLRNGHDGAFAASVALGARVFVCDNLSFSGEVVVGRMHTRFITRDLPGLVSKAIGALGDQRKKQEVRFDEYKKRDIEDRDAHSLILRGMLAGVVGETKVREVLNEWEQPFHDEFKARSVWSLFNAFTEIMKPRQVQGEDGPSLRGGTNLAVLGARTQKLHGLLDAFCGFSLN